MRKPKEQTEEEGAEAQFFDDFEPSDDPDDSDAETVSRDARRQKKPARQRVELSSGGHVLTTPLEWELLLAVVLDATGRIETLRTRMRDAGFDGRLLTRLLREGHVAAATEAHDGGDEEQCHHRHKDERHGDGALPAPCHVLGAEGLVGHGILHPRTGVKAGRPMARSARISAKTMNSHMVEKPNSFLQALSASWPSRMR